MALPRGRSIIPEGRSFFLHLGAASYSSQACASVRAHQIRGVGHGLRRSGLSASTLAKKFYLMSRNNQGLFHSTNSPLPSCRSASTRAARPSTRPHLRVGDKAR